MRTGIPELLLGGLMGKVDLDRNKGLTHKEKELRGYSQTHWPVTITKGFRKSKKARNVTTERAESPCRLHS